MTLDITQWAERYGQWRQASLTATTLPIYTVFLIAPAMMMVFGAMYVDGGRIARTVAVLLAVSCVALLPGYWGHSIYESTLNPAPLIQVVEGGIWHHIPLLRGGRHHGKRPAFLHRAQGQATARFENRQGGRPCHGLRPAYGGGLETVK